MKPIAVFRHSPGEGPGYFATFLDRHALPWRLLQIDAGEAVPPDCDEFSGLALFGGPMSVNDPLPWIEQECALIRQAVALDVPVIGHCLGGQLLAKALGAEVRPNPVKEIGWGKVRVLDNAAAHDWLGDLRDFLSFHWHGETFSLPAGGARILESEHCAAQAFVLGPHLGLQCHVEMTEAMIRHWCVIGAEEIATHPGPSVQPAAAMQADLAARLGALNAVADRLYERWGKGLKRI
ncbi:MAG TPA: type 1 glutamine amidotransferase [Rhodocyclaceae bacterium]|nr:type 1 glutamine amidotransferase [Rhodocyclaceae bacterium]